MRAQRRHRGDSGWKRRLQSNDLGELKDERRAVMTVRVLTMKREHCVTLTASCQRWLSYAAGTNHPFIHVLLQPGSWLRCI